MDLQSTVLGGVSSIAGVLPEVSTSVPRKESTEEKAGIEQSRLPLTQIAPIDVGNCSAHVGIGGHG